MKPTVIIAPCAYCGRAYVLDLGAVRLTGRKERLPAFKCDGCGSRTEVEISTKRAGAGAGYKKAEAQAKADWEAEVERRAAANKAAGDALLAEPGCTCKPSQWWGSDGHNTCNGKSPGHFLSTGWSREKLGMMPTPPHHQHGCPRSTP